MSSIDLKEAYWQIGLDEESRQKVAFMIPGKGLFQFRMLPYGLKNAAACLARLMDEVIGMDLEPYVFLFLDDIVVCTDSIDSNLEILGKIAKRLKSAGLRVNMDKSALCRREIKWLGYILREGGLATNPEKVKAVVDYPLPRNVTEMRRFIGFCGWYRRFIHDFSSIIAPLSELTKKPNVKNFNWNSEANAAFLTIKEKLIEAPVLASPDYARPFVLQTDASDHGVSGILSQVQDDCSEKPIAFFSQKFSSTEKKYTTTEKECLAVLLSVEKFRCYIEGTKFEVVTDHSALLWLLRLKTPPSARLARWILRLQPYEFTIVHRKGKDHILADALSRAIATLEVANIDTSDEWYIKLREGIIHNPKRFSNFKVDDEKLFKLCKSSTGVDDGEFLWKQVLPKASREDILKKCHDENAHFGVFKTLQRLKQRFYWPKMSSDVESYIRTCENCHESKDHRKITSPPMGAAKTPTQPWQVISMDFLGPFPRSSSRNTHLFVVYDQFSKYVLARPMTAAVANKVCEFLEYEVFLHFSTPQVIISDNGSQFTAEQFKSLLKRYKVKHWLNARYHSQHNPSERINGVLTTAIRSYLKENHKHWDRNLKNILVALNTSVSSVTKFTPHFLNFGKELKISGDEYVAQPEQSINDFVDKKADDLSKAKDFVIKQLDKTHLNTKKRYDLRTRIISYKRGDIVWRKNFRISDASKNYAAKLGPRNVKCMVLKKIGSSCYELGDLSGRPIGIFHAKDFYGN